MSPETCTLPYARSLVPFDHCFGLFVTFSSYLVNAFKVRSKLTSLCQNLVLGSKVTISVTNDRFRVFGPQIACCDHFWTQNGTFGTLETVLDPRFRPVNVL